MVDGGGKPGAPEVVLEEKFMLVARGIETTEIDAPGEAYLRIGQYWMRFRSARGQEFTLRRYKPEELPQIELGAVHWIRVAEKARIVDWLRRERVRHNTSAEKLANNLDRVNADKFAAYATAYDVAADAIERGEHLERPEPTIPVAAS